MEHYLLNIEIIENKEKKFRREVGTSKMRMERLLGDAKMLKHTLEYNTQAD